MIKNIIFDMGNVLLKFDPDKYVDSLKLNSLEERTKIFNATYVTWKNPYLDRGDYSEEQFVDAVCEDIGENYRKHVEQLIYHWSDPVEPVAGMAELIKELKEKGYKIFLLSNAGYRQHEYWDKIPGSEYFDGTLVSCDVKCIKPERKIYESLYNKFNIKPEESFFIDDLPINIFGARESGMEGFVFHGDVDELRTELNKRGIL